ncbi:MAG: hypothetical protein Q9180_008529, partial [Flavoplaca navasiana]
PSQKNKNLPPTPFRRKTAPLPPNLHQRLPHPNPRPHRRPHPPLLPLQPRLPPRRRHPPHNLHNRRPLLRPLPQHPSPWPRHRHLAPQPPFDRRRGNVGEDLQSE